jgi:hypothetical protein
MGRAPPAMHRHPLIIWTQSTPLLAAGNGRRDWIDVDKRNSDDPQACSAYAQTIFAHLREAEVSHRSPPSFSCTAYSLADRPPLQQPTQPPRRPSCPHAFPQISKRVNSRYIDQVQREVNAKMRAILVDWLVEVSEEYKLCADTLYQAVAYVDKFLSIYLASRSQLQLIGVTCMWLASKYEEIYPPNVADFCYITDNTYSRAQLIQMEELVLKQLSYELTMPTAKTFLRRLLQVRGACQGESGVCVCVCR